MYILPRVDEKTKHALESLNHPLLIKADSEIDHFLNDYEEHGISKARERFSVRV